jgi:hypothetical protein
MAIVVAGDMDKNKSLRPHRAEIEAEE